MTKGEKVKAEKKTGLIGFYKKKLLFFALLALLAAGGVRTVYFNKYQADTEPIATGEDRTSLKIDVEILNDGKIEIDGNPSNKKINLLQDGDEARLPVLDAAGVEYTSIEITLALPQPVAKQTEHQILAIHGVGETNSSVSDDSTITYLAEDVSGSAVVSIVAKMPKGTVNAPVNEKIKKILSGLQLNVWVTVAISLPVITIIFMSLLVLYQTRRQRIEIPDKSIDSPPMALPPSVVGALVNQRVRSREIAATLIDLAVRGDIAIIDRERSFAFGKGKFDQRLLGYEKVLLSKIFQKNLSSDRVEIERRINNHFYSKKISLVSAGIYALSTRLGYFKSNPQKIHARYRLIGILALAAGLGGFILSLITFTNPPYIVFFWVGMMLAALIIIICSSRIPIRSILGQEALANWYAFRKFLSDPKPMPFEFNENSLFIRYLPYAIVLNCEAAWAKRFARQNFIMPGWFLTEKGSLGLEDFCLALFPIISYVSRSLAALREPGFE